MSDLSNTPISPRSAKAAYRREEKRILLELANRAEALAQLGLNYAELYIGRVLLAQSLRELNALGMQS